MTRTLLAAAVWLAACTKAPSPPPAPSPAPSPAQGATPGPAPAAAQPAAPAEASQLFGAELDPNVPELTLAALLAAPAQHAGKTIRTRGTIERVCQRMGCWMEIRDADTPSAVRVPMAGHAFFLPQTVKGRRAAVQGEVSVTPLSEAHKAHLKEEGALATDVDVSIVASGVRVE